MLAQLSKEMESARVGGPPNSGGYGQFQILCPVLARTLTIVASDGRDWFEPVPRPSKRDLQMMREMSPKTYDSLLRKWEDFPPDTILPAPVFEHVSVSARTTPSWDEMSWVKDQFWGPEECVMQLHPPKSQYVNDHPHALHLWLPKGVPIPLPPRVCV